MKKKLIALLTIILVVAMMLPAFASAEKITLAYSNGSLTLRMGAGTSYSAVAYLKDGDTVTVLNKGSVWSKVRTTSGKEGYVKNLYISGIGSEYASGNEYFSNRPTGTIKTKYASSTVNLRSGASTSTASISKLANGTSLKVLGQNGGFYLVETTKGTQGYVSKTYVSTSTKPSIVTATVTASALNMRQGAGSSYGIVTTLAKGTKVTVISTSNASWWKVQYGSKTGYMSSKYLKKN